jgi:hypothetical protein
VSHAGEPAPGTPGDEGSTTAPGGTAVPVDAGSGAARAIWAVVLAGPLIWTAHFMVVYLVTEAGCSGDGPGLSLFDPPVPQVVTLAATAMAAVASLACAGWAYRRWRAGGRGPARAAAGDRRDPIEDRDGGRSLAFAGFLLSLLSFVTILFVGLPALVLSSC